MNQNSYVDRSAGTWPLWSVWSSFIIMLNSDLNLLFIHYRLKCSIRQTTSWVNQFILSWFRTQNMAISLRHEQQSPSVWACLPNPNPPDRG